MKTKAVITSISGTKLKKNEADLFRKYKPWGIILFKRNISSFNQLKSLIKSIKKVTRDKKYPILIDEEGGSVSRMSRLFNNNVYSQKFFGDLFRKDKKLCLSFYENYISSMSSVFHSLGININTVPVLDIIKDNTHNIIGTRSFSRNKETIKKLGKICLETYKKNKIGTVIKHIPGHGLAKVDSHNFTPIINKKLNYLLKKDFKAFKNKKTFFAMTGHIIFNKIDKENTVTHSKKLIGLIRNKIGFKNILISDDLSMKSLKKTLKENTIEMFNAGCNLALHCNGNIKEMEIVGKNAPLIDKFLSKKTSQFYKILR